MHLLVLSAFRLKNGFASGACLRGLNAPFGAQCFPTQRSSFVAHKYTPVSMHLLVLSAFRLEYPTVRVGSSVSMHLLVLSAFRPAGSRNRKENPMAVSMHLLVLSAFRHGCWRDRCMVEFVCVSMHLLVLSAFRQTGAASGTAITRSQCTFWCSVLSDGQKIADTCGGLVSMHLLVLSAFRPEMIVIGYMSDAVGLNAPFGAQCFPTFGNGRRDSGDVLSQCTFWCSVLSDMSSTKLALGFWGSQCTFWCSVLSDLCSAASRSRSVVSMHLLVLSAFRLDLRGVVVRLGLCLNAPFGAQCFPT